MASPPRAVLQCSASSRGRCFTAAARVRPARPALAAPAPTEKAGHEQGGAWRPEVSAAAGKEGGREGGRSGIDVQVTMPLRACRAPGSCPLSIASPRALKR